MLGRDVRAGYGESDGERAVLAGRAGRWCCGADDDDKVALDGRSWDVKMLTNIFGL